MTPHLNGKPLCPVPLPILNGEAQRQRAEWHALISRAERRK